jgi:hypothetical protein
MGLVIPARQIRPSFPPRSRDHHAKSRRNRATGSDHQKHGETLFHRPPPPLLAVVPGPRERNAFCVIEGGGKETFHPTMTTGSGVMLQFPPCRDQVRPFLCTVRITTTKGLLSSPALPPVCASFPSFSIITIIVVLSFSSSP